MYYLQSKKFTKIFQSKYLTNMMMMMMINYFCGTVDRRKTFRVISSRGHFQRSSPLSISNTLQAGFQPVQNLSSDLLEQGSAVRITTTSQRHKKVWFLLVVLFATKKTYRFIRGKYAKRLLSSLRSKNILSNVPLLLIFFYFWFKYNYGQNFFRSRGSEKKKLDYNLKYLLWLWVHLKKLEKNQLSYQIKRKNDIMIFCFQEIDLCMTSIWGNPGLCILHSDHLRKTKNGCKNLN